MKEQVLLWKAIHDLEIDLPVLSYEVLGAQAIRLNLYGGRVVEYALPPAPVETERTGAALGKRKSRREEVPA